MFRRYFFTTHEEHRWKPARRFTADMLRRVERGWSPSMQQGMGKARQLPTIDLSAEATAESTAQRETVAFSVHQGPEQMQGQEVETPLQTTTMVSMTGAGARMPADGGAQPAANLAASAVPQAVAMLPTPQATAAVQTDSSMGRDQPAAVAQLPTAGVQTTSQAEKDLYLAQQGRLPLPKAAVKVCRAITGLLRRATEQARQGYITEAERVVCMALDKHEEELLVVLGNVPLEGYRMGAFVDVCSQVPTPEAALQQSQCLLQVVPEHFLGQLGQALSRSMLDEQHKGESLLQPVNLAPGPLGMASAADGLISVVHKTLQLAKGHLKSTNLNAVNSIAAMSAFAGSGYQQVKQIQEELHRQHGASMSSIRGQEPREWSASFKAVGNMVVGNFSQAENVTIGYLEQYKGHGCPLWAHMLKCYAQMHDTQDPHQIQQIADELRRVARDARQASMVHLAPEALPGLPTDVTAYIKRIEETAGAATQLVRDFDAVHELAAKLATQWEWMTEEEVRAGIAEGSDKCSHMLDSNYAGSALSVRLIGRVYGLRARFHLYARDYILASSDSGFALSLNPHQCQVLADWIQMLRFVTAYKAMSCVLSVASEAIRHVQRSGEECALDEAGRMEQVNLAERQLQRWLAESGEAAYHKLVYQKYWHFFCGGNRRSGRQFLLEMSPDKLNAKAGTFGDHMVLKLAYLPQLITTNMAELFQTMRENHQSYQASFPADLPGAKPEVDLNIVLGYNGDPPPCETYEAEDTDMEDASNVSDGNHCQDSVPTSPDSSCSARDSQDLAFWH